MTTFTNLTTGSNTASATGVSDSILLHANRLGVLDVVSRESLQFVASAIPTIPGWTLVDSVEYDTDGSNRERLSKFRRMTGTDDTGTHTITFALSQAVIRWSICESDTDVVTTGTNGENAVVRVVPGNGASVTSLTITMPAFESAANGVQASFAFGGDGSSGVIDISQGTGFTILGDVSGGAIVDSGLMTEYISTNDTSVDATNTITSLWCGGLAIEVRSASSAPSGMKRTVPSLTGGFDNLSGGFQ